MKNYSIKIELDRFKYNGTKQDFAYRRSLAKIKFKLQLNISLSELFK